MDPFGLTIYPYSLGHIVDDLGQPNEEVLEDPERFMGALVRLGMTE